MIRMDDARTYANDDAVGVQAHQRLERSRTYSSSRRGRISAAHHGHPSMSRDLAFDAQALLILQGDLTQSGFCGFSFGNAKSS